MIEMVKAKRVFSIIHKVDNVVIFVLLTKGRAKNSVKKGTSDGDLT